MSQNSCVQQNQACTETINLPIIRNEDLIRCTGCGDCVRACFPGVLKLVKQEVTLGDITAVIRGPVIAEPENCHSFGHCLPACSQKVFPLLYPQNIDEVKKQAAAIMAKSETL